MALQRPACAPVAGVCGRDAALGIGLLEPALGFELRAAGIVVGLLGFAVFVDGALALAQQVENLSQINVAPNFGPLFRRLGNGLQGLAEGVGAA